VRAAAKTAPGPGNLEYMDLPEPTPGKGEVLVEVKAAGICGTDLSLYQWKEAVAKSYKIDFPRVLGHEFSGVVREVAPGVTHLAPGDRVVVNPVIYCGKCRYCVSGMTAVCENRPMLGAELDGAFAEFVTARASNVVPIPDEVTFEAGAVVEPLCVAIQAVEKVPPTFGDVAVVVGSGPIGLLIAQVLSASCVSHVVVTGLSIDCERLEVARQMGAIAVNIEEEDPLEVVKDLTSGDGADIVFEAAGYPNAILQAIDLARKRGTVLLASLPALPTEIPTVKVAFQEKSLVGTRATTPANWTQAIRMIAAGKIDPTLVVSHTFPLPEAVKAFEMAKAQQGIKILLVPGEEGVGNVVEA